jgi:hypothetical protein
METAEALRLPKSNNAALTEGTAELNGPAASFKEIDGHITERNV